MGKKYWRCPVIMRALYLSAEIETDIYTWIKDCIREHKKTPWPPLKADIGRI
jgi:preprotein translocase subunit SecE